MSAYDHLLYDVQDHIATITFNRPDRYNALNVTMLQEIAHALSTAGRDHDVYVIAMTGEGKAFCAGQDLSDTNTAQLSFVHHLRTHYSPLITKMRRMEKPIVGAINGVAAGAGLGLALACDLRMMASTATLVFASFSRIALIPDAGLTYFLPRLLGTAKAYELVLLGDSQNRMPAAEAQQWGLTTRVADTEPFSDAVAAFCAEIAALSVHANGLTKRILNASWDNTLEAQLDMEAQVQEAAGRHPDLQEGIMAFLEKRPPNFNQ